MGSYFFLEKGFREAFLSDSSLNREQIGESQGSLIVDVPNSVLVPLFESHFQIFEFRDNLNERRAMDMCSPTMTHQFLEAGLGGPHKHESERSRTSSVMAFQNQ